MKARIFTAIFLLCSITLYAQENNAPVVENVRFEQRNDGSLLVDIYYDVTDVDGDTLEITLESSYNHGRTWACPCNSFSGDVGNDILSGADKHIIWNFYTDSPDTSGSSYQVRIIANDKKIQTGTITDIDGNVYNTVKIGNQWWMAENLKVKHYRNGDVIPHVTVDSVWAKLSTGARCVYNNDISNLDNYGYLYNLYAIEDGRNIAIKGWHVPADEEWKELEMHLGMSQQEADSMGFRGTNEGDKLKSTNDWDSGTNIVGFSALPGGYRYGNGGSYAGFIGFGGYAYFWTASSNLARTLYHYESTIYRGGGVRYFGYSIRLVKD